MRVGPAVHALIVCCLLALGAEAQPLRVGVILPLSGEFAIPGEACRKGIELAASELNARGAAVEVVTQDSPGAQAAGTLSAYRKLRSVDRVDVFLGFVSTEEVEAVAPVAASDGSALVGIGNPRRPIEGVLVIWMSPEVEAAELAALVVRQHKDVALLSGDQGWETQFSDAFTGEFRRRGGRVVLRADLPYSDKDVTASVARLRKAQAKAVVIPPYALFSAYARALHKLGLKLPIFSVELDQAAVDGCAGTAEGALVIRPKDPEGAFSRRFAARYGGKASEIPAPQCYDGLLILSKLHADGARTGKDFRAAFAGLRQFTGASGSIHFLSRGTSMDTELLEVKNGRLQPVHLP